MDLELEVKKLERRETKDETPYTWMCGCNQNFLPDIIDGCGGFNICNLNACSLYACQN